MPATRGGGKAVLLAGEPVDLRPRSYDPTKVSDFSHQWWGTLYTRECVEALHGAGRIAA